MRGIDWTSKSSSGESKDEDLSRSTVVMGTGGSSAVSMKLTGGRLVVERQFTSTVKQENGRHVTGILRRFLNSPPQTQTSTQEKGQVEKRTTQGSKREGSNEIRSVTGVGVD